jgi:ribosomal protein S18 acetylase RimI-like enzyme
MMKGNITQHVLDTLHTEGLKGAGRKAWKRLSRKPTYRQLLVLVHPFTEDMPVVEPKLPVTIEELQPPDFDEVIALRPYLNQEVIQLRIEAGHRFYVAKLDERIVHVLLAGVNRAYIGYLEIAFPLSAEEVYFGEAYTVPQYRGNHIGSAVTAMINRQMSRKGYRRSVLFIHPSNTPSLRVHRRIGSKIRGRIGWCEILGIRRYFYWARNGGFDCLDNCFLVRREALVPAELQGQIW